MQGQRRVIVEVILMILKARVIHNSEKPINLSYYRMPVATLCHIFVENPLLVTCINLLHSLFFGQRAMLTFAMII